MLTGQCHCGAIHYEMTPETVHHALCHCQDCRRASGGVAVSWGLVAADGLKVEGGPKIYASSEHGRRHFCGTCGTSLFYPNDALFHSSSRHVQPHTSSSIVVRAPDGTRARCLPGLRRF